MAAESAYSRIAPLARRRPRSWTRCAPAWRPGVLRRRRGGPGPERVTAGGAGRAGSPPARAWDLGACVGAAGRGGGLWRAAWRACALTVARGQGVVSALAAAFERGAPRWRPPRPGSCSPPAAPRSGSAGTRARSRQPPPSTSCPAGVTACWWTCAATARSRWLREAFGSVNRPGSEESLLSYVSRWSYPGTVRLPAYFRPNLPYGQP